jgi:hypothetical protein
MWKSIYDMFRQALSLAETSQRNHTMLKELQKEVRDLSRTMDERQRRCEAGIERLAFEVQRLRDELRYTTQHEADEREKLQLKIENKLLKLGRQLPPSPDEADEGEE